MWIKKKWLDYTKSMGNKKPDFPYINVTSKLFMVDEENEKLFVIGKDDRQIPNLFQMTIYILKLGY